MSIASNMSPVLSGLADTAQIRGTYSADMLLRAFYTQLQWPRSVESQKHSIALDYSQQIHKRSSERAKVCIASYMQTRAFEWEALRGQVRVDPSNCHNDHSLRSPSYFQAF